MKVGLVLPGFSAGADDWCIPALRHLARELAVADDVRVVAVRYPYRAGRYTVDGAEVISVGGAERRGSGALTVWRGTLDVLRAEHRRRSFDVLHAFWATESGLLTAVAGKLLRIPTLVSLAGGELVALPEIGYGDQRVAWERLKIRASLRLASGVTAGSRHLASLAARHVARRRLHRAPLGVDLDLFNAGSTAPSEGLPGTAADSGRAALASPRLVHVGTLTAVKDQATLLRAFRGARQRIAGLRLDIVGDGPLRTDLERLAQELGAASEVRFRGVVDHAALPGVYREGSALVVSSRHEAQSMVAVEAAACGLSVVGTCVGVIPELAHPDSVVPVGDAEALAAAIVATCTSSGRPAGADVRAIFGLEPCTARFRTLYARLIAG